MKTWTWLAIVVTTLGPVSMAQTGTPSDLSLAYIEPDTNNAFLLTDGATMPFPNTVAGTSSSMTLVLTNNGSGNGIVDSIVMKTGSPAFQLTNLPALPATVPASQQLRFAVRFSPQSQQAFSGSVLISVNGRLITINLQGQAIGAQFTYTYGSGSVVASDGIIALGDTSVGQTAKVTVLVTNKGTADGQISALTVTGNGFSLSDLPAIPFTLRTTASQTFSLVFSPTQPGVATGRLIVGGDTLTITANGVGSRLIYSYTNTSAVSVAEGGVVILSPIEVGKPEKVQFTVQNTGTSAATISSINLAAASASFMLEQLPAMPFNLDPNSTSTFTISFTPNTTGNLTAVLQVNNSSFTLSGSGTQPASLPSYQFRAPSGSPQPAQQPSIGLTLSAPYPVELAGSLTLTFVSNVFTDDPSIQFASGGRTASFIIPANSTEALFNGNSSLALQTGTTAGSIIITPSFTLKSGFNMTPAAPDTLRFSIQPVAPQLLSASITSQSTTGFTVVLNGYSTTRALRQLNVQITPRQGQNFSATALTIDVSTAASAWYQGASSQGTGGSFVAAIPFALSGGSGTDDLVRRLQSLSITATNETGVSNAVTVPIP